ENELSAGAFTPSRKIMLELLASQAAISLENARLHSDLESANQAKDELLAVLGHELRNSLAPVLTACALMAMHAPAQFTRERLVIERQVKYMMRLVDDLLDVSRIARGKIERAARRRVLVVDDNVDAAQLLVEALEAMGHAALVAHDGPSALATLSDFQPDVA